MLSKQLAGALIRIELSRPALECGNGQMQIRMKKLRKHHSANTDVERKMSDLES